MNPVIQSSGELSGTNLAFGNNGNGKLKMVFSLLLQL